MAIVIIQRFDNKHPSSSSDLAPKAEYNLKIAVALAVMNECFLPIIDRRIKINQIHSVLYNRGSDFNRPSHIGFHIFILE